MGLFLLCAIRRIDRRVGLGVYSDLQSPACESAEATKRFQKFRPSKTLVRLNQSIERLVVDRTRNKTREEMFLSISDFNYANWPMSIATATLIALI